AWVAPGGATRPATAGAAGGAPGRARRGDGDTADRGAWLMKRAWVLLWLLLLLSPTLLWAQGQLIPGNRTLAGVLNAAVPGGTSTAYTLTLNPPITAYVPQQQFWLQMHLANTGAATLAVDTAGAKALKKWASGALVDLAANDLRIGQAVHVLYDGTVM